MKVLQDLGYVQFARQRKTDGHQRKRGKEGGKW